MVTAEPDITRLLARLKALKLIRQQRDKKDRRVVTTFIADTGLTLLSEMDPVVSQFPARILGHLTEDELQELIRLLEKARQPCDSTRSKPTCDGKEGPSASNRGC
jgi:DNA-binding MarR family transcriptional regulator